MCGCVMGGCNVRVCVERSKVLICDLQSFPLLPPPFAPLPPPAPQAGGRGGRRWRCRVSLCP